MHFLAITSFVFLALEASATHVKKVIPEIDNAVNSALNKYRPYTAYKGPAPAAATQATLAAPKSNFVAPAAVAAPGASYWLEQIKHQGIAAFNPDTSYKTFRNVKDYGAKG